jgi:hypothetical protein
MNFLEQLAAEWYSWNHYFVRTNVPTEKLLHGGHSGELDVLAYEPKTKKLIHIETSSDTWTLERRKATLRRKMRWSHRQYERALGIDVGTVRKIAVAGWTASVKDRRWGDIEVMSIGEFVKMIWVRLSTKDSMNIMVPEGFPLLRTIQIAAWAQRQKGHQR